MNRRLVIPLFLLFLAFPAAGVSQPIARPVLEFPATGAAAAHAQFIKGIIALHNAGYEDAAGYFAAAEKIDPTFVMAYWGEAMTFNHTFLAEQDMGGGRRALSKLAPTRAARAAIAKTQRERDYLNAIEILYGEGDKDYRDNAYAAAMETVAKNNPGDHEASVFHALSLFGTMRVADHSYARQTKAAAILTPILQKYPNHPGVLHYLIHAYDAPSRAGMGLDLARRYEKIMDPNSHALHMASHIYVQLGMWGDVARANQQAFDASDRRVKAKGLSVGERDYHALEWLIYAESQLGQYRKVREHAAFMLESAKQSGIRGMTGVAAIFGARASVETGQWDIIAPYPENNMTAELLFAQGMAAIGKGDRVRVSRVIAVLNTLPPDKKFKSQFADELSALLALAEKRGADAERLAGAVVKFEAATEFPSGPPDLLKPAHELYGEILLALNKPLPAAEQFELSLKRMPKRTQSLLGLARARTALKDAAGARKAYRELVEIWAAADAGIPAVLEARTGAGK